MFSPKALVRQFVSFFSRWSFGNEGMTRKIPKIFLTDNLSCLASEKAARDLMKTLLKETVNGKLYNGIPGGTQYQQPVDRNVGESLQKSTINDFRVLLCDQ